MAVPGEQWRRHWNWIASSPKFELQDIQNLSHRHIPHLVSKLCKNKYPRYWFKATLTPETRIGYICYTNGYQRGICDDLEISVHNHQVGYSKLVRQNQLRKASLQLFLLAVIDYDQKRPDTSLYSTKSWSRISSLRYNFVDLHWSIFLAYTSNILLT